MNPAPQPKETVGTIAASVLRILAYFDIFDHPLTATEIHQNYDHAPVSFAVLKQELNDLVEERIIERVGIYYFLPGSKSRSGLERRENTGGLQEKYIRKAYRYSRLIAHFPFVRSISISGSISKGSPSPEADVDYFIITSPGRLWICRTLLAAFKKIFLFNSHKYFCINYLVDTDNLAVPDRNIFTATEIAFLIPTFGYRVYEDFLVSNQWVRSYYPNKDISPDTTIGVRFKIGGRIFEWLLHGAHGNLLESMCRRFNIFLKQRKFRLMSSNEFHSRLKSTRGVSKHHPNSFQPVVLKAYGERLLRLEDLLGFKLF